MRNIKWLPVLLFIVAFSISCAPRGLSQENLPFQEAISQGPQSPAKESWDVEWEKTLALARKEGKVTLLTLFYTNTDTRTAMIQGFKKATGITLEITAVSPNESTQKLITERRAGLYISDLYMGGPSDSTIILKPAGVFDDIRPLLFLPEVVDPNVWYKKEIPWMDREKRLIIYPLGTVWGADLAFNNNLVKFKETFSFQDLLNPGFKGKMNMQDPTVLGKGNMWFSFAMEDGIDADSMKALVRQEPLLIRDIRQQLEWLIHEKQFIAISPTDNVVIEFLKIGAPIALSTMKEFKPRITPQSAYTSVIRNAPHPNAAKLFVNWFLNKEGQTLFSQNYPAQSARLDVPANNLLPFQIRKPGVDYTYVDEETALKISEYQKLSREIFGPLLK